tara:strand:+ start:758 stop:1156 length:399 start_codon:yes stop_codon:yes gene_type:complete
MKTIDMRPKQNEKGRRKTFKDNYYFHPSSNYIGHCCPSSIHPLNGKRFAPMWTFMRQTKKLFTMKKTRDIKIWGYGETLAKSASNCRKWYGIKIPSTGWKKIQFIYHEPITFRQENPVESDAKFLKFMFNEI